MILKDGFKKDGAGKEADRNRQGTGDCAEQVANCRNTDGVGSVSTDIASRQDLSRKLQGSNNTEQELQPGRAGSRGIRILFFLTIARNSLRTRL